MFDELIEEMRRKGELHKLYIDLERRRYHDLSETCKESLEAMGIGGPKGVVSDFPQEKARKGRCAWMRGCYSLVGSLAVAFFGATLGPLDMPPTLIAAQRVEGKLDQSVMVRNVTPERYREIRALKREAHDLYASGTYQTERVAYLVGSAAIDRYGDVLCEFGMLGAVLSGAFALEGFRDMKAAEREMMAQPR